MPKRTALPAPLVPWGAEMSAVDAEVARMRYEEELLQAREKAEAMASKAKRAARTGRFRLHTLPTLTPFGAFPSMFADLINWPQALVILVGWLAVVIAGFTVALAVDPEQCSSICSVDPYTSPSCDSWQPPLSGPAYTLAGVVPALKAGRAEAAVSTPCSTMSFPLGTRASCYATYSAYCNLSIPYNESDPACITTRGCTPADQACVAPGVLACDGRYFCGWANVSSTDATVGVLQSGARGVCRKTLNETCPADSPCPGRWACTLGNSAQVGQSCVDSPLDCDVCPPGYHWCGLDTERVQLGDTRRVADSCIFQSPEFCADLVEQCIKFDRRAQYTWTTTVTSRLAGTVCIFAWITADPAKLRYQTLSLSRQRLVSGFDTFPIVKGTLCLGDACSPLASGLNRVPCAEERGGFCMAVRLACFLCLEAGQRVTVTLTDIDTDVIALDNINVVLAHESQSYLIARVVVRYILLLASCGVLVVFAWRFFVQMVAHAGSVWEMAPDQRFVLLLGPMLLLYLNPANFLDITCGQAAQNFRVLDVHFSRWYLFALMAYVFVKVETLWGSTRLGSGAFIFVPSLLAVLWWGGMVAADASMLLKYWPADPMDDVDQIDLTTPEGSFIAIMAALWLLYFVSCVRAVRLHVKAQPYISSRSRHIQYSIIAFYSVPLVFAFVILEIIKYSVQVRRRNNGDISQQLSDVYSSAPDLLHVGLILFLSVFAISAIILTTPAILPLVLPPPPDARRWTRIKWRARWMRFSSWYFFFSHHEEFHWRAAQSRRHKCAPMANVQSIVDAARIAQQAYRWDGSSPDPKDIPLPPRHDAAAEREAAAAAAHPDPLVLGVAPLPAGTPLGPTTAPPRVVFDLCPHHDGHLEIQHGPDHHHHHHDHPPEHSHDAPSGLGRVAGALLQGAGGVTKEEVKIAALMQRNAARAVRGEGPCAGDAADHAFLGGDSSSDDEPEEAAGVELMVRIGGLKVDPRKFGKGGSAPKTLPPEMSFCEGFRTPLERLAVLNDHTCGADLLHTQVVIVAQDYPPRTLYVGFRGTYTSVNARTDARFFPLRSYAPFTAEYRRLGLRRHPLALWRGPLLHPGFLDQYARMAPFLIEAMAAARRGREKHRVVFTGHSLGGALATIALVHFCIYSPGPISKLITFGSPRVGNMAFVQLTEALSPHQCRVSMDGDTVAGTPPWFFGYLHSGTEVVLDTAGNFKIAPSILEHMLTNTPRIFVSVHHMAEYLASLAAFGTYLGRDFALHGARATERSLVLRAARAAQRAQRAERCERRNEAMAKEDTSPSASGSDPSDDEIPNDAGGPDIWGKAAVGQHHEVDGWRVGVGISSAPPSRRPRPRSASHEHGHSHA